MNARIYAKWFVTGIKVCFGNYFYGALSVERSQEEKDMVMDKLYHRLEETVAQAPEDHAMSEPAVVLCVEKVF